MKIDDILDNYTIDGLEVEVSIIEAVYRGIRPARVLMDKHASVRDGAAQKAKEALEAGDNESYQRMMEVYWKEDRAFNFLRDSLHKLNIETKGENR